MKVVYEDNHLIIVDKSPGEIVQGDKTGDKPLSDYIKDYLKHKYDKPGNVFCGVIHRLDRPVSGLVAFARTSKALERMNRMFREGKVEKTYWALVEGCPDSDEAVLENYLISDSRNNKTYITDSSNEKAKMSKLTYRILSKGDKYTLLEVHLLTGRKHQIRAQLSHIGHPVKGDLKYGARRSKPDGGISLQSHSMKFIHPVAKQIVNIEIEPTEDMLKILKGVS